MLTVLNTDPRVNDAYVIFSTERHATQRFLLVVFDNRRYRGASLRASKCAKQIKMWQISRIISLIMQILQISCLWKAVDKIEKFKNSEGCIWGSVYVKVFKMNFQSLHHLDVWLKAW